MRTKQENERALEILKGIRERAKQKVEVKEWNSPEEAYQAGYSIGYDRARDEFKQAIENIVSLYRGD